MTSSEGFQVLGRYTFVIFMLTIICDNRNCGSKNDDDKKYVNDNTPSCHSNYPIKSRFAGANLRRNPEKTLPVLPGGDAFHPEEEAAEGGRVGIVDPFGDFVNAQVGAFKKPDGLHQEQSVDVLHDGPPGDLPDNPGEIGGRNVQGISVEINAVFVDIMLRKQVYEVHEQVFRSFPELAMLRPLGKNGREVHQEECI